EKELAMLGRAVQSQDRHKIAIFGGVKADDSIAVSKHMLEKGIVDKVLTTGGVANMFLQAGGFDPGTPTTDFMKKEVEEYETYVAQCKELLTTFRDRILMPMDVVVNDGGKRKPLSVQDLPSNLPVQDIGLDTIARYIEEIEAAKTIFFNGPAGVFEKEEFSIGTRELLSALAESDAFTVAGGGHTVAAIEQYGLQGELDHVSTGGGALINFLAGKELPLVAALERSYKKFSAKKE
ncbi:MAG TPA: phosphoglycerate kinase, partial [Thermoplasmata archaeon]|nr:phosphoglycerate kinase [Thermoplasmata archaeon]